MKEILNKDTLGVVSRETLIKLMLKSYVVTTLRGFARNKGSFLINLLGLVLAFTCCSVIVLYVQHELSYDTFHEKADRIFRVTHNEKAGTPPGIRHVANVGPPVGPALKATFPQVEDAVRFRHSPDRIIRYGDRQFYESGIFYADPSVFHVFTFPLAAGDAATALRLPNAVVITPAMASKYFGEEDPMGKVLTLDHDTELIVTGVLAPLPGSVHLRFDFLLPFEAFKVPFGYPVNLESWGWISFHTYVLLKPGEDAGAVQARLPEFVSAHWPPERAGRFRMELQPLTDIYLGDVKHETVSGGNKTYLISLSIAGILILVVAGFNFANLFAASSASRAKEMGVRKVIGAQRRTITFQLLGESVLIALAAALISVLLLAFGINQVPGVPINTGALPLLVPTVIGAALMIGLLGGIYPSAFLAGIDHHRLLRGAFRAGPGGQTIRMSLLLAQFTVSILLVGSVFVIDSQVRFLVTKDLGYASHELMVLRLPGDQLGRRYPALRDRLMQNPHVESVSVGGGRMDGDNGSVPIVVAGVTEDTGIPMAIDAVTFDFFKTIGVTPIAGREFSESSPADTLRGVILNASAAKTFGWSADEALGKRMRVGNFAGEREVIGVIPDFHFGSLRDAIGPLVISYPQTHLQDVYVRFRPHQAAALVASVASDWQAVIPDLPFDYSILSDHLGGLYRSEQTFLLLFRLFAVVAIAIACLGLYGLVSQDVVYRVREIGIRKVLGASVSGLTALLLRKFLMLVVVANMVAWPACWQLMQRWLGEFTYHEPMNWLVLPLSGGVMMTIALLTVGYKTVAAAKANPVKSIRNEGV